jgi:hypothetical protein
MDNRSLDLAASGMGPHSRRGTLRLLAGGILAASGFLGAGDLTARKKKKKKKRNKTPKPVVTIVTRTFSDNGQIAIPAMPNGSGPANPYPALIEVSGFTNAKIIDVDLTLRDFSHGDMDNVEVLLVKDGLNALVLGDISRDLTIPKVTITLDDEASVPLPETTPLMSGRFQPRNYRTNDDAFFSAPAPLPSGNSALSVFDGLDPNGSWRLFIVDDVIAVDGSITGGWELTITAEEEQEKEKKKKNKKKKKRKK